MPREEVKRHYQNTQKGMNYFDYQADGKMLKDKTYSIKLDSNFIYEIDKETGLIIKKQKK